MQRFPIQVELPDEYTRLLGQIVVLWSAFEYRLRMITNLLLDLDLKRGRIAARDPRPEEHIDMIEQLMTVSNIDPDPYKLGKLRENLRKARSERDLLVHGLWVKDATNDRFYVQRVSGYWKPDAKTPKVNRRINPTGERFQPEDLENHLDFMADQFASVEAIFESLALMEPSKRKPR